MDGKSNRNDPPPASEASRSSVFRRRKYARDVREDLERLVKEVEALRLQLGLAPSQEDTDLGL